MAICCRVLQLGASRGNFNDYPKPFLVAPRLRRRSNICLTCEALNWRSSCCGLSSSLSYRKHQNCKNCANSRVRLKQLLGTFSSSKLSTFTKNNTKSDFTNIFWPKNQLRFYILIPREEFESTVRKNKFFLPAALEFFSWYYAYS